MAAVFLLLGALPLLAGTQTGAEELYAQGIERYNDEDYEEAVRLFSRAAALRPNVPDYRYHLGLAYLKVGRARQAATEMEAALGMMGLTRETRVKEPMVLVQAAIAYLRMGKLEVARERAERALKRVPDMPEAHYLLGLIEREDGNGAGAAEHFQATLAIDRDHPDANLALAEWLEAQGRLQEALESLRHASHGAPSNFEILLAFGALAHRLNDLDEAAEAFELARRLRPEDDEANYNLGTVWLAQKRFEDAIAVLRPLVERERPHDDAAFNLAQAYRESGAHAEARVVLRELVERKGDFPGARFSLGLVSEALGDTEGAEEAYRAAIRDRPLFLPAYLNLAALLESLGRPQEALELLRSALEIPMDEEQARILREAIESLEGPRP